MSIIFMDVDGTLVDYEGNIPSSAIEGIRQVRANGHLVFLCTGRSKAEGYDLFAQKVGFDGYIGANGGYIEHQESVLAHHSLSKEECQEVVEWLKSRNMEFYLESNEGLFASENFETRAIPTMELYSKRKGKATVPVREAFHGIQFNQELIRSGVNKISYILNSYEDFLETKKRFPQLESNTWGGKDEEALFGDVAVLNIDKGKAAKEVCEYLNIPQEESIAIGDAKIDIPMLRYCHLGIAMGNGGPEIKEMADHITDDILEDGLYNAFKKFNLI